MPSDLRLGLVVGVGLVIVVAVVAFRKDDAVGGMAGSVQLPAPSTSGTASAKRIALRMPTPLPGVAPVPAPGREHVVQEGETLFSLAVRYYGDGSRSSFLFRANQDRLLAPDRVPAGTVLYIPDLPGAVTSSQGQ
jgi:nucleoid-associated protein YgaU